MSSRSTSYKTGKIQRANLMVNYSFEKRRWFGTVLTVQIIGVYLYQQSNWQPGWGRAWTKSDAQTCPEELGHIFKNIGSFAVT